MIDTNATDVYPDLPDDHCYIPDGDVETAMRVLRTFRARARKNNAPAENLAAFSTANDLIRRLSVISNRRESEMKEAEKTKPDSKPKTILQAIFDCARQKALDSGLLQKSNITFKGKPFILIHRAGDRGEGAITTDGVGMNLETSHAYLQSNGTVRRLKEQIGTAADIVFVDKDPNFPPVGGGLWEQPQGVTELNFLRTGAESVKPPEVDLEANVQKSINRMERDAENYVRTTQVELPKPGQPFPRKLKNLFIVRNESDAATIAALLPAGDWDVVTTGMSLVGCSYNAVVVASGWIAGRNHSMAFAWFNNCVLTRLAYGDKSHQIFL